MIYRIVFLLAVLVGGGSLQVEAQTVISGRVLGADGTVMPATHVLVTSYFGSRRSLRVIDAPDGRYAVEVSQPGVMRLRFVGPLHQEHEVAVLVEDGQPVELDVQLQRAWMDTDQSFTRVVTLDTKFDYEQGTPLEEQADGSFAAMVAAPGDTVVYGMPGAQTGSYRGWVIEAMTADSFVYTRDGYRALVASPGDQVRVSVRPQRLNTDEPPVPLTTFSPASARAEALWAYYQKLVASRQFVYNRAIGARDASQAGDDARETALRDHDNMQRQEILALEIDIEKETDAFRRDLLLMLYLSRTSGVPFWNQGIYRINTPFGFEAVVEPKPDYLKRALDVIPPTSMGWTAHPALLQVLVEKMDASEAALAYVESASASHPVEAVRRYALFNLFDGLFARRGFTPEVAAYLEQFKQTYGAEDDLLENEPLGRPTRVVAGRRAPDFGEMRLGVSSDSLKGRVVLLDFWASWCDVCAGDEEGLRQAHTRYVGEDFQIVRVSLDYDPLLQDTVATPWHRYQGPHGFRSSIAAGFEVLALPRRVLIDRDGVILATDDDLFGDRLTATLQQVFGK